MNTDAARQILDAVSKALSNRKGKTDGTRFNLLEILRVNQLENRCSDVLAAVLDPRGTHCLGSLPLRYFCEMCLPNCPGLDFDLAWIGREVDFGSYGRVDFYITDGKTKIVIESKINAGEQPDQINRYWQAIGGDGSATNAVYFLTWNGHQSNSGTETDDLAWSIQVCDWLKVLLRKDEVLQRENVQHALSAYYNLLSNYRSFGMDDSHLFLDTDEHVEAAFEIYNALKRGTVGKAVEPFIRERLEYWAKLQPMILDGATISADVSILAHGVFSIATKDGFIFYAEFQKEGYMNLYYGLLPGSALDPKTFEKLKEKIGRENFPQNRWWYTGHPDSWSKISGAEWVNMMLRDEKMRNDYIDHVMADIMNDYKDYAKEITEARKVLGL